MLAYIDTSFSYISACKMQICIDKMRLEMGVISENEFRERVKAALKKIIYEAVDIKIYTSSNPFRDKFLKLTTGERTTDLSSYEKLHNLNISNSRPEFIENKLAGLFNEIKEIINYQEYKDLPKLPEKNEDF
ncbi:MAG: hypothetical protein K2X86_06480 [Cytophagaceae bacterium]|nr:hypothetical protein [Cytophagaceae bacterium]